MYVGIDYGSKLAGTTVIAWCSQKEVSILQSKKNEDADAVIRAFFRKLSVTTTAYIDAPLSLPGVYRHPKQYTDYFYRAADKEVAAMSPMFLGGLTARAMKLQAELLTVGVQLRETYPKIQAQNLELMALGYKKETANIPEVAEIIEAKTGLQLPPLENWHQVDGVLAMCTALKSQPTIYGNPEEGLIYV